MSKTSTYKNTVITFLSLETIFSINYKAKRTNVKLVLCFNTVEYTNTHTDLYLSCPLREMDGTYSHSSP